MTARMLPIEEWDRLPEYMDPVLMRVRPCESRMCVVEDDHGEIVGRVLLYPIWLAEDAWVREDVRGNPGVGRQLLRVVRQAATELGVDVVASALGSADAVTLLHDRAEPLPPMVAFSVKGLGQ